MNNYNLKSENIIGWEKILYEEYIINKMAINKIAKKYNKAVGTIFNHLKKFNIKTRTHLKYSIGERFKKHYCIGLECNKEISYCNYLYGSKMCRPCSRKKWVREHPDFQTGEKNPCYGKHWEGQFKKDNIPWNKDKKGVQKSFRKGQKYSEISGSKHWHWKGGITPLNIMIRNLAEYGNWRDEIFIRDNYICQECFCRGGDLEVHHKKTFSIILGEFLQKYKQFSPIEDKETLTRLAITYEGFWNVDNGITLCKDCHKKFFMSIKESK